MLRWIVLAISTLLSGCFSDPHQIYEIRQPDTKPVRNVTNMDAALACMDNLMAKNQLAPIYLTSLGIPNRAGDKVAVNSGIDMLQQAISLLSKKSNVFRYVDLSDLAPTAFTANTDQKLNDHTLLDPTAIQRWIESTSATAIFNKPQWVIAGSISQVDDSVTSETRGGSVSVGFGDFGLSADQISSIVSLDLRLIDWNTRQLRNGSALSNGVAVLRTSKAADVGARLKSNIGAYIDVSNDNNESGGQAVRTLIQFSVMQLLGNLINLPYQQCLQHDTPPSYEALVQEVTTPPTPQLQLTINTSKGRDNPIFRVNEALDFSISVNKAADVHCYISDANQQIHPLFPNLSQTHLTAQQTLNVAINTPEFSYNFDKPGFEQLFCLASPNTLQSPWAFDLDVQHAATLPVGDIKDVESGYRQKTHAEVVFETLTLYIRP